LTAFLFSGPAGMVGAAAVKVALGVGVNGNAALLFGRMCSWNGKPFWELRVKLAKLLGVSTRSITRYWAALVDAGLIVNKPAPLGATPPGCMKPLPYRPWYKWAIGLPEIRQAVKSGSRDAYERWITGFEARREERVTRSKLGAIIGSIVNRKCVDPPRNKTAVERQRPRRWTSDELETELRNSATSSPPPDTPDTS
jgi:hypothetical protein